jgi:hypothetical protein
MKGEYKWKGKETDKKETERDARRKGGDYFTVRLRLITGISHAT